MVSTLFCVAVWGILGIELCVVRLGSIITLSGLQTYSNDRRNHYHNSLWDIFREGECFIERTSNNQIYIITKKIILAIKN
jgi:hypothetical protein